LPWAALGREGEQHLLEDGISVHCLVREDNKPVDDPGSDDVDAIVARAY
jgi:prolyl-tRNA synthetase